MTRWLFLLLCALAAPAWAQPQAPNGILLVARPGLEDPRFSETVVLVTQTDDFQTLGVILNRPSDMALSELMPDSEAARRHAEPLFYGGPVLGRSIVALFRSAAPPGEPAFHVLKNLYLSMHPAIVERLLGDPQARYRLYAGFSGWRPRQLEGEMLQDSWYLLPADEEIVFRKDTSGLWRELLEKARAVQASATRPPCAAPCRNSSCRRGCPRGFAPSARSGPRGSPSRADSRSPTGSPA
jgi:putative transcriptional regulator